MPYPNCLQHRLLRKRANDDGQSTLVFLIIICNLALINALFSGQASGRNFSPARRKAASVSGKAMTTQPDRQIGFFLMFRILVVA